MTIDFDTLPEGPAPADPQMAIGKPEDDGHTYIYVDYDTIHVDPVDRNKIYGNWAPAPADACQNKVSTKFVDRRNMQGDNFLEPCPGSRNGIWRFTLFST